MIYSSPQHSGGLFLLKLPQRVLKKKAKRSAYTCEKCTRECPKCCDKVPEKLFSIYNGTETLFVLNSFIALLTFRILMMSLHYHDYWRCRILHSWVLKRSYNPLSLGIEVIPLNWHSKSRDLQINFYTYNWIVSWTCWILNLGYRSIDIMNLFPKSKCFQFE